LVCFACRIDHRRCTIAKVWIGADTMHAARNGYFGLIVTGAALFFIVAIVVGLI
jgi:hypothetical protein